MKRHTAKLSNTDQRCVVIMMQIPNREDHALILATDNLPPRYEQAVMTLLESAEGQAEEVFGSILSRRIMPDTGKAVLDTLHDARLLSAVPCANVIMMPQPNMPVPLLSLLERMGKYVPNSAYPTIPPTPSYAETTKYNQHNMNRDIETADQNRAIGHNLLEEAKMLEHEAAKKREQAYTFNPSLRPTATPAPAPAPVQANLADIASATAPMPLSKPKRSAPTRGPSKKAKAETVV